MLRAFNTIVLVTCLLKLFANAQDAPKLTQAEAQQRLKDAGVYFNLTENHFQFAGDINHDINFGPSLSFSGRKVTDESLSRCLPAFQSVEHLDFSRSTTVTDKIFAAIAQLPNLKSLRIAGSGVTGEGLRYLAGCSKLVSLKLQSNGLTDEHLKELSKLSELPLTHLTIGGNECSEVGLKHIASFPNLTSLTIQAGIDSDGKATVDGKIMNAVGKLKKLQELEIAGDDIRRHAAISDDDLGNLAKLPGLTMLSLASRQVTDEGMKWIGQCKFLKRLTLWQANISDNGVTQLKDLNDLTSLCLYDSKITGVGFGDWVRAGNDAAPPLRTLVINGTRINDDGLWQISKLKNVNSLTLGCCFGWFQPKGDVYAPVTDAGLAKLTLLPRLNSLRLAQVGMSDFGLSTLSRCRRLKNAHLERMPISTDALGRFVGRKELTCLRIADCPNITRENLKTLKSNNPSLRIEWEVENRVYTDFDE